MAYIEKKLINGEAYYYLTETKRVGSKFKKTRKYIGKKVPADLAIIGKKKQTKKAKIANRFLNKKEIQTIESISKRYSESHSIDKSLWQTEKETIASFIYNTNAIEGNTLTIEETRSILNGEKPKSTESKRDVREVQNMRDCIDFLFDYSGELDEEMIKKLHFIEQNGIMGDAGKYRDVNVRVGTYICPDWNEVPKLMKDFVSWYRISKANPNLHPFELASLVHLKFVRIHPFRDGNGRMARLLMNFVLLKSRIPLLNIFNDEKTYYYLILQKYDFDWKERSFVQYLFEVFALQYKNYFD